MKILGLIANILLIPVIIVLTFLIFLFTSNFIFKDEIYKNIDICYDKNNNYLSDNIAKMEKQQLEKEGVCKLWGKSVKNIDRCIKQAYKIPYVFVVTEEIKNLQELKEKQAKTCKEYPRTVEKNEVLKFNIPGRTLLIDINPWVQ